MIKSILIISSNYTGNGHKSISQALPLDLFSDSL